MNYPFPFIQNIDQIKPLFERREEFILSQQDGYSIAQYLITKHDTFPSVNGVEDSTSTILRELRGIAFDSQGKVISRPFHKFFNLNEREETLLRNLDFSRGYDILEKLDGSMIRPIPLNGQYRLATKLGISQQSMEAETFIATRPEYDKLIYQAIALNYTPIFEWCNPKLKSVVRHKQEQLTILAIRHNWTGQYLSLAQIREWVKNVGSDIPIVKSLNCSVDEMLQAAKTTSGVEGYVIRFHDGEAVKHKSAWYLRLHRLQEDFELEKFVLDQLINGTTDDIYPVLNDAQRNRLQRFENQFWQGINAQAQRFEQQFESYRNQGDRKWFALNVTPSLTGVERQIYWNLWKQTSARQAIIQAIANNLSNTSRIDSVRFLWGNHNWN